MSAEGAKAHADRARVAGRRFTTRELARLARLSSARVRGCVRAGFLRPIRGPRRRFEFAMRDLLVLRAARPLLEAGLGPRRVAAVVRSLESQLPAGREVSSVKLTLEGGRVCATDSRRTWSTESGQLLLNFGRAAQGARVCRLAPGGEDEAEKGAAAFRAFQRGMSIERRAPEEAKAAYREVLRLDPEAVPALVNLGRLEHRSGELAEAERLYLAALRLDPAERTAAFNLAVVAEDRGDQRTAVQRYEQALRIAPDLADAHHHLARLRAALGDRIAARRHRRLYRALLRGEG